MDVFKNMGSIPKEERGNVGRTANQIKSILEAALAEKSEKLHKAALTRSLNEDRVDVTLPGRVAATGPTAPCHPDLT